MARPKNDDQHYETAAPLAT